jgi:subtilisin-like proprotein convertase family protein
LPIISDIDKHSTEGFTVYINDTNSEINHYEIEIGIKGFTRTLLPNLPFFNTDSLQISGLLSGQTYEFYLRTECRNSELSDWNGPYFANTIIDNDNACNLELEIPDNNCPNVREFLIEVALTDDMIIGQDIDIRSVNLSIEHTWPPDLRIQLRAPSGESVMLSRHNGNGRDNYGVPEDIECQEMAVFTDEACLSIENFPPPLTGEFKPLEDLRSGFQGVRTNGIWALEICDRANGDVGNISALKIEFVENACLVPDQFTVDDIEADNVTVSWISDADCINYRIAYRAINAPLAQTSFEFVECNESTFTIERLIPDTEYIMTITTRCTNDNESLESCEAIFRTACDNSNFTSSFNNENLCSASCNESCLDIPLWHVDESQNNTWLVNTGSTPSEFTGPSGDINGKGNYIYIENNNQFCHSDSIILQSDCLTISAETPCNVSFHYHMYGSEINQLQLQYKIQDAEWMTIWERTGEQGNEWLFESIKLPQDFNIGQLRFLARRDSAVVRNDIALDQIKIIGLDTFSLNSFFVDSDNDGFGDPNRLQFLCSDEAPIGFSDNSDDCDDSNPSINPDAVEINCNLIDENCNGNADDNSPSDLDYELINTSSESCRGIEDGTIQIIAFNGQEPYTYLWSNGARTANIDNLSSGIYTCTISDIGTCQIVTEPIFVDFQDIINYSLINLTPPSCQGIGDGSATLLISGGNPPYEVIWNDTINGSQVNNLAGGTYQVTITDNLSCSVITEDIQVTSPQSITAGVAVLRDVDCSGDNNGFIQLGISGGTPPYNIEWSNGAIDPTITQLTAGDYSVTITDRLGCSRSVENITISEPDQVTILVNNKENNSCTDDNMGMVDISVFGGTAPYSYFWSNGNRTEDLSNIASGTYSITVSDINACITIMDNIIITEPDPIALRLEDIISVNCPASTNGTISVDVIGGQPNYIYNWNTTDGIDTDNNSLDSLGPGFYSLTVVDDFGCKSIPFFFEVVNRNRAIDINLNVLSEVLCHGDSTASIIALTGNGTGPYDYNWSNGTQNIIDETTDTINLLIADRYNLTITDSEGCIGIADSITISQPEELSYEVVSTTTNACWYDNQAEIQIEVKGGTDSHTTLWNNGSSGDIINDLSDGIYTATITDVNNCKEVTTDIILTSHDSILIEASVSNSNGDNGTISIEPTLGLTPFTYTWNGPINLPQESTVRNLIPGDYTLRITDREGCFIDTTFTIDFISSIDNTPEFNIKLYPNPGSGHIQILSDMKIKTAALFNIDGRKVMDQKTTSINNELSFDVSEIEDGLYYIQLQSEQSTKVLPYIKSSSF